MGLSEILHVNLVFFELPFHKMPLKTMIHVYGSSVTFVIRQLEVLTGAIVVLLWPHLVRQDEISSPSHFSFNVLLIETCLVKILVQANNNSRVVGSLPWLGGNDSDRQTIGCLFRPARCQDDLHHSGQSKRSKPGYGREAAAISTTQCQS
ncbi:unnamed protein product [Clavelina lepadiformis]|uniref:Uncharacterized protein n=1 Tax=Clavelina lepadiformis TaxID=159417 RepID=A0ABP0FL06_CLALP